MQFRIILTAIAFFTLSAALPTGLSFSDDLKTSIAQTRTQERDLATSNSLSEEKRAYGLEVVEVAAFKFKRSLDSPILESDGPPSTQTEERPSAVGNHFDPNDKPGSIVENYEDALDVSSPGYAGLGKVVETLG